MTQTEIPTLSELLRTRTQTVHTQAERSGILHDILTRKADRGGYVLLLRNLVPAYRALERALSARANEPAFAIFARSELQRAPNLISDIAALAGADWERTLPLVEAAESYAEAITQSASGGGAGLVAHAYVRYFGDLSGGQILKKMLGKTLDLPPQALSFYDFPQIADPKAYKDEMRRAIDVETIRIADAETVVAHALRAFECNIALSNAVQRAAGMAMA